MRSDPHPLSASALIVDVGSSATKLALVTGERLTRIGSFPTGVPGADCWQSRFGQVVAGTVRPTSIGHVAVSSAVPSLPDRLRAWWVAQHGIGVPVRTVGAATAPLEIDYRPPAALGPDRLADAVAATARWGAPVIVVDVGTAITCDLVSARRRFAGGAIAPGPSTSYQGLVDRVPHLALGDDLWGDGDLPAPATSTLDGLRAGVIRGAAALVDSFVHAYHRLVGPCPVVVTGGLGATVARHSDLVTGFDPDLTLWGVHLVCAGAPTATPGRG